MTGPQWGIKRISVLKSRGNRCEICQEISGNPHVHHVHYERLGSERDCDLQVLCTICHKKEHQIRPRYTFRDRDSLLSYVATLSPKEASRRFPAVWIPSPNYKPIAKENGKPKIKVKSYSRDGYSWTAEIRPNHDPRLMSALMSANYRCSYCDRPVSIYNGSVAPNGVTCGCHLVAEYIAKKEIG